MGDGEDLFELTWRAMNALAADVHAAAAERGLTPMQAMLLDRLDHAAPVPMSELARQLHCDKSNLTGVVDTLESRGLVERTTPRDDRRVRALLPTPAGRDLREDLRRRLRSENPLLGALSTEERRQLAAVLGRLVASERRDH